MQRRFIQLVIRARRLVTHASGKDASAQSRGRPTGRRQVGSELTQFSFRLAFVIDLAYVGVGALGGAAIGRATAVTPAASCDVASSCGQDTIARGQAWDTAKIQIHVAKP